MANPVCPPSDKLLDAFRLAASQVPAYATILKEHNVSACDITTVRDFGRLPILDKRALFGRFAMHELTSNGDGRDLSCVLTSSGHSGDFSYGVQNRLAAERYRKLADDVLVALFGVDRRKSLLVNCLPMGVRLFSDYCTLGEVSVRADMACALVRAFARYHEQIIMVGETAFIKHVLETGIQQGIDWRAHLVQLVLGGELVAENARKYFQHILGGAGLILTSMGIGEVGLNLFFEAPPLAPIIKLRRILHEQRRLRGLVLGEDCACVPAIFSYDPNRIYVEFVDQRLVITTLAPPALQPVPLVRYSSGDQGGFLRLPQEAWPELEKAGIQRQVLEELPLVTIRGRGQHVLSEGKEVFPEQIKEGLYHDCELARMTTANFRMIPGQAQGRGRARIRIQLVPGVQPSAQIEERLGDAIANYLDCPLQIVCEPFDSFRSGMNLDYERKFDYLGA